jgi:hypothetical protein
VTAGFNRCRSCNVPDCKNELIKAAVKGRSASHSSEAEAKRAENRKRQVQAIKDWQPSDQPDWLNKKAYLNLVRPRLTGLSILGIRKVLAVSKGYATHIRSGERIPHERHWQTLAKLVGISDARIAND